MRKLPIALAIILVGGVLVVPASADIIRLNDGSWVEGTIVEETGDELVVELRYGTTRIPTEDVESIERGATRNDEIDAFLEGRDPEDPQTFFDAAEFADEQGLAWRARDLRQHAIDLAVEQRVEAAGEDADALWDVAEWVRRNGYGEDRRREVLERVLHVDTDHEGARNALGYHRFEGRWLTQTEIDRIEQERFDRRMQADGYLRWRGQWIRPDAQDLAEQLERIDEREASLDRRKDRLDEQEHSLARRADRIDDREAEVVRLRDRLETHRVELNRRETALDRRENELDARERRLRSYHTHVLTCPSCSYRWEWRCAHVH